MKLIKKLLRFITRVILFPFLYLFECFLAIIGIFFEIMEDFWEQD